MKTTIEYEEVSKEAIKICHLTKPSFSKDVSLNRETYF